jgi:hypothetical protein
VDRTTAFGAIDRQPVSQEADSLEVLFRMIVDPRFRVIASNRT